MLLWLCFPDPSLQWGGAFLFFIYLAKIRSAVSMAWAMQSGIAEPR